MNVQVGAGGPETPVEATAVERRALLRHVAMVTHCVAELDPVAEAWQRYLGFVLLDQGNLSGELCAAWDTPAAVGQRYCLLQPASGQDCLIRFIETGVRGGHGPPLTQGWLATELLATDPDALAAKLADSPFTLLGGPGDLFPRPRAPRAMQMRGPAGELLYFTRILPNGSRYGLKGARSEVDRPFIVTVGGTSSAAMHHFYGGRLGQRILDTMPFINPILAAGCGVPHHTIIPTSLARIPGRSFLLEMDELPAGVAPRNRPPGQLPGGMAMVSFRVESLDALPVPTRAPLQSLAGSGYKGERVVVIEGPTGEWLELIEASPFQP